MEITLTIDKTAVMEEVAHTTSYTGAKMENDSNAFDRISTVDEDDKQLERFWEESRADLCQELIGLVTFEGMVINSPVLPIESKTAQATPPAQLKMHYELRLDVSNAFDNALLPSMHVSLFSFFVQSIAAKWYVYTNKKEAGEYADKAISYLDDVHRKALYKKRPVRPTYND